MFGKNGTNPVGRSLIPDIFKTTGNLTTTIIIYTIEAGITAAAGTRLSLQLILDEPFKLLSFRQCQPDMVNTSLFLVTTSQSLQWVIYAPAAFLRCASRFSGCLSGIEPWFPVTRYKHGSPIPNHRNLISQYFEWPTVAEAYGPLSSLDSSEDAKGDRFKERKNTTYVAFSKY